MERNWRDDLNRYISVMGDKIDSITVTPKQARDLLGIKKDDTWPPKPWLYEGKKIEVQWKL